MRRAILCCLLLAASLVVWTAGPSAADGAGADSLSVSGTGVGMYPDFRADITRYAITSTEQTSGTVTVAATAATSGGVVEVEGRRASGPVTVDGLEPGEEVSVIVTDGADRTAYALVYLPAGFPALTVTTGAEPTEPGDHLGITLNTFSGADPRYNAIIDRNGVPVWVERGSTDGADNDLQQQPGGEITLFRPTTEPGHTGSDLVVLDERMVEIDRRRVGGGLTNTDSHDALLLADGSTVLMGYEPGVHDGNEVLDATIQKLDPTGTPVFTWDSRAFYDESLDRSPWPPNGANPREDYAHINSVVEVPDGTGDLVASFRHFSAVFRIATRDRDGLGGEPQASYDAGDVVWKLGGRDSSFAFVDDPESGPCAQHTARLVDADTIVIFDNGSPAGCVDPADPTGDGIARYVTRVTEYDLDIEAGTATLVDAATLTFPTSGGGDEQPAFALFAGSSQRLDDGHTLIGWGSERHALATEIDADGTRLWEIRTPARDPLHTSYMSYRVSSMSLPDVVAPEVSLSLPSGPHYTDRPRTPEWSCTDRGGSTLQRCEIHGLLGGRLATTAGTHTVTVTAVDGADNTTTAQREYRVRAPRLRPDGWVRTQHSGRWKGKDVYGGLRGQKAGQRVRRGRRTVAKWMVQNDGERHDRFTLRGRPGNRRFAVRYVDGTDDVTRRVVAGRYRTPRLAPGEKVKLRVVVRVRWRASRGDKRTFRMVARSRKDDRKVDRVAAVIRARR